MTELAPSHVGVQVLRAQLEARGQTLDNGSEAGTMRFPSRGEAEASHGVNLQAASQIQFAQRTAPRWWTAT